ncbi:MAG: 2OG-Fe dioxygenase family protein [Pseudoxanthomonas sp.]
MTSFSPAPPVTPPSALPERLRGDGFAVIDAQAVAGLAGATGEQLQALAPAWDDLPADAYLRDGGHYRRRRHDSYVLGADGLRLVPHRAHWQSLDYNALHGGMQRWFEPVDAAVRAQPAWQGLIAGFGALFAQLRGTRPWYIEAHQFRIDTTGGIGRPTPEGAHRDGVDFVAVVLVERSGIKGGETRVFDAEGPQGLRFTLAQPWSAMLMDDARVIHESTPIQPVGEAGHRDTLVLTYRAGGFQGEERPRAA